MSTLLASFNEGVSLSIAGQHEAAIRVFDRVLSQDPLHVLALSAKGSSLASLGRPADALKCFERAIDLDPETAEHYRNAALCQLELDEPELARPLLDQALLLNPENGWREGTAAEIAQLGEVLATESGRHRTRGIGLSGKARYRHARHVLELALELHPGSPDAARALADVWAHLGDTDKRDQYTRLAGRLMRAQPA
ncbi:tetratricopeptide repeat protein [Archangium primigenium]|uniref:tetratricopeptide repeat protein n=1 Tax=[Archangium] primigenium TaxID=2792470 RepID=UPI00195E586C|nr:tetratricopeptide repeat protein [Archangium primigenium]MBM7117471.1 tetratricopeptide repeat protein [Archangium primigenium]